jgi:PiT family inorganic phosphate transporter
MENGESDSISSHSPRLDRTVHPFGRAAFILALLGGLAYAGYSIFIDTSQVGESLAWGVFAFLGLALLIALGFEFVNGFHDTANAVATVIYTNSMSAPVAVIWSGVFNFLGVMFSTGAVAYSIVTLLPVDLRAAVCGGRLESGDLVYRPAQFIEPCADRINSGRGICQPVDVEQCRRHVGC